MNIQHLSDEAVAAFADGVLSGHARDRARRHVEECSECRTAVRVQREAAIALRAAPEPALPTDLMARLCLLPQTTPISTLPTALGPDGSTVLRTRFLAPMSGLVPTQAPAQVHGTQQAHKEHSGRRRKPIVTAVAVAALAGALSAGSVAGRAVTPAQTGGGQTAQHGDGTGGNTTDTVVPVSVFRAHQP